MTDISLDKLCDDIMKMVRDMASNLEIEQLVTTSLAAAYEAGYSTCENEHAESEDFF
jgi:hypothetical protein